jgi:3-methylfumaryl-CoA hydratase
VSFDNGEAAALVGRSETRTADAHAGPALLLQATLDRDIGGFEPGAPLPLLWHWLYFPPTTKQGRLGEDGHTYDSGLLPALPAYPRRMWAGSRLQARSPLRVGDRLIRRSTVAAIEPKAGKSGRLLFVTLSHEISGSSGGFLAEEQDLVFREPASQRPAASSQPGAAQPAQHERTVEPTPPLLFRFSALTFNGHRIHYDHPYATQVEGYEGLVVHGPLLAVLMLDLLDRVRPDVRIGGFRFKALSPAFAPHPLSVKANTTSTGFDVWVESRGRQVSAGSATPALAGEAHQSQNG